ncbi:MAG: hypothetical protein Tsb008_12780 [Rhodothalassiaceae bacterium]
MTEVLRGLVEQAVKEGARRVALLLVAFAFLLIALLLLSGAMVVGLATLVDLWLALLIGALVLAGIAGLSLLAIGRERKADRTSASATPPGSARPEEALLEAGTLMGAAMRKQPKTTLFVALMGGVLLGANPSLRRDLIALARSMAEGSMKDRAP